MTPESKFTATAVSVAVKELAMKLDVVERNTTLFPWKWGNWDFAVKTISEDGDVFTILHVDADGSMHFDGPVTALGASAGDDALIEALILNNSCEFVVRGPEGDVNVVGRTELFGVPNYETIWKDLVERREDRKVRPNGQPITSAIGRGKADRELYFADAVDIANCKTPGGKYYYRVGLRGYGMHFRATHKASLLREVIAVEESKLLVEDMLPMLDVYMVRWGEPTVVPFPIKYLREWMAMNSLTEDGA